jgi:hypothetical protein
LRAILSASGILRIRTQRGRHRPVLVRSRSPFSISKPSKNRSRSKRTRIPAGDPCKIAHGAISVLIFKAAIVRVIRAA